MKLASTTLVLIFLFVVQVDVTAQPRGWKTNWDIHSVDLSEIISGGVPKDGIPPIDSPKYTTVEDASDWISPREPVVFVNINGDFRAYPLQILTFHEIVNTTIGGKEVTVTFCPLCYSTLVFDRNLNGELLDFGVSGMLRNSDLVMYDRQTESLWQQILGEAIVGDMTGQVLSKIPSQIISFEQFAEMHPEGKVLSRDTGHQRNYGQNPYPGYDDIDDRPFLYSGILDDRLPPMERVITLEIDGEARAYPYRITRKERVINDSLGNKSILVVHSKGALSALDKASISGSEEIGSTGVFDREVNGQILEFESSRRKIIDTQTKSVWDITGLAVEGELTGTRLKPITHGNYFSFAWFAFKPDSEIYSR